MPDGFQVCIAFTLRMEGGFVNNPADPGGATNMGITLATLSDWRGEDCTAADVKALTRDEASSIYGARYWNAVRGHDLPSGVDLMVFDHAVLAGVSRSASMMQLLAHVATDGSIGPQTIAAVGHLAPVPLIQALSAAQTAYYRACPGFPTFGHGWLNRVTARTAAALALVRAHAPAGAHA